MVRGWNQSQTASTLAPLLPKTSIYNLQLYSQSERRIQQGWRRRWTTLERVRLLIFVKAFWLHPRFCAVVSMLTSLQPELLSWILTDRVIIGFLPTPLMNMDTHIQVCVLAPTRMHTPICVGSVAVSVSWHHRRYMWQHLVAIVLATPPPAKRDNVSPLILQQMKRFSQRNSVLSQM